MIGDVVVEGLAGKRVDVEFFGDRPERGGSAVVVDEVVRRGRDGGEYACD
jgi:hypothetical protein